MERMAIDEKVYQRIESGLDRMQRTNQKLIRHGTEKNRDLIAAEFEKDIRGISEALREIEVIGSVGGHRV